MQPSASPFQPPQNPPCSPPDVGWARSNATVPPRKPRAWPQPSGAAAASPAGSAKAQAASRTAIVISRIVIDLFPLRLLGIRPPLQRIGVAAVPRLAMRGRCIRRQERRGQEMTGDQGGVGASIARAGRVIIMVSNSAAWIFPYFQMGKSNTDSIKHPAFSALRPPDTILPRQRWKAPAFCTAMQRRNSAALNNSAALHVEQS